MKPTRRKFLTVLGGGVVVAAGAAGGFAATRRPGKALAPWDDAGIYEEPRRRALSYALLAPNPHNRQPWVVDLPGTEQIVIWRDKAKNLPHTDPYDRQLTIGMGCFLELLTIAASQTGHGIKMDLFPEGDDGPIANVRMIAGVKPDPLFAHVTIRRTCREAYAPDQLTDQQSTTLSESAVIVRDETTVGALRNMTWEAFQIELATDSTWRESVDLTRIGKAEINAAPDGLSIGGPIMEALSLTGLLSREAMLDRSSVSYQQALSMYEGVLYATPAYAVITTNGNSRLDQIDAGRRWMRLALSVTGQGLSLHPVSQALQEYPEMAEKYAQAHQMLAAPGETVQMLGRVGHGPKTPPAPRWPLESKLRHVG
ncbi:MAG: Acg family FMN-binding oxidoreductase [Pikeienuella sp.]